ncbi:hypothetical protein DW781_10415 [Olsenella sp. AM30-3LB]|nr:hypothetical protein DW781_10415 [Olsenella sp. AM30-3LB]
MAPIISMLKFSKPVFIMRQSHVRVPRNVRQTSHKNDLRELARKTVGGSSEREADEPFGAEH